MSAVGLYLALVAAGITIQWLVTPSQVQDVNDTDPLTKDTKKRKNRSQLGVLTDAKTGCQYLVTGNLFGIAAITPRLDKDGKHMQEDK